MIIKLLGGFLLVLCGGMLGLGRLKEIKSQLFTIEEMDRCLALMESEIALCERPLPDYTRGEEIFNMVSHIVGGSLGVVATVLCTVFAAIKGASG